MSEISDPEKKANDYAARRLRELRGQAARSEFGPRIGVNESTLYSLESQRTKLTIGRLASIAHILNVPLASFIPPNNDESHREHEREKIQA